MTPQDAAALERRVSLCVEPEPDSFARDDGSLMTESPLGEWCASLDVRLRGYVWTHRNRWLTDSTANNRLRDKLLESLSHLSVYRFRPEGTFAVILPCPDIQRIDGETVEHCIVLAFLAAFEKEKP